MQVSKSAKLTHKLETRDTGTLNFPYTITYAPMVHPSTLAP